MARYGTAKYGTNKYGGLFLHSLVYDRLNSKRPKILITDNEIDIFALGYCSNFISIVNEKTFQRDKIISDSFDIEVNNFDGYFSIDNPKSLFYQLPAFQKIKIYDSDEELVFEGYIENITRDYNSQTATLKVTDALYVWAKQNVTYVSSGWETPAMAFKNICAAVGFTAYNSRSVDIADGLYVAAGCYIKINYPASDPIQFQNILEDLGRIAIADIFSMNGLIYFKHWTVYAETPPYVINEKDMKAFPVVQYLTEEMVNDYSIGYDSDGGTPAIDSANDNIGALSRTIYGNRAYEAFDTASGTITVKNLVSAVYLGNCLIKRSTFNLSKNPRPLYQIEFDLKVDTGNWIDITSFFMMNLSDEVWNNKIFEVMRIEKIEDENTIKVKAYEIG